MKEFCTSVYIPEVMIKSRVLFFRHIVYLPSSVYIEFVGRFDCQLNESHS